MGSINSNTLSAESEVYVYKTTVTESDYQKVAPVLNQILPNTSVVWNFDFEDCDNILRVEFESSGSPSKLIKQNLNNIGFDCEELI